MRSASSVFSKPLASPPNPLREDILLEGFEQAGKQVTEHVLDALVETADAEGILLIFSPPGLPRSWVARGRGRKALPEALARPLPGCQDTRLPHTGLPHTGLPYTGLPCTGNQRWPIGACVDLGEAGTGELYFTAPRAQTASWAREHLDRISLLLSISVRLDGPGKFHPARQQDHNSSEEPPAGELRRLFPEIIGQSAELETVLRSILQVADSDIPVLIRGESGTGKELVAAAIHRLGSRKKMPFVCENCGAIAEQLAEAELFGHEKGAFTGASIARPGLIERAHRGTLFLDEVSEMVPSLQKKLLRVLQEKAVRRVGALQTQVVDFRLISATNRDLEKMITEQTFREDLYYRLNVTSIRLPSLRQRREDIPSLVEHFAGLHGRKGRREPPRFSAEILSILSLYDWPGNIRELGNEIWRLVETVKGEVKPEHLSKKIASSRSASERTRPGTLEQIEKDVLGGAIVKALEKTHGNRAQAARLLGIGRATLYRRLTRYGLQCE